MIKKLIGQDVSLAPVQMSDAEKWAEWLNDLEVIIPLGDEAYTPITVESMRKDITDISNHNAHVFTIVQNESDSPIGRCLLFAVNQINRSANLGIFIGEKQYWNLGYGKEAIRLILDYAFNLLNLNNVMLGVFEYNQRAYQAYLGAGFKEIGRRRQARIIGGQKYDLIFMDLLAEEFGESSITRYLNQQRW